MKKLVVIDYGIGNVRSIQNAFRNIGVATELTRDIDTIAEADGVLLPGVGAFEYGMLNLKIYNLIEALQKHVEANKPLLGICLGMQMLFESSEEYGDNPGLGFIKGSIIKFPVEGVKLPHVGWNEIKEPSSGRWNNSVLSATDQASDVYFVHSFVAKPKDKEDVLAESVYGDCTFCAAVSKGKVFGAQFHPEKSGEKGMEILRQFVNLM